MSDIARLAGGRPGRTALAMITCLLLASCQTDGGEGYRPRRGAASPTASDSRLIALVGTLSGPDAWRGEDAFEGADVAVQVLNRKLPAGEPRFELVSYDDRGDAEVATRAVAEAVGRDRTKGIVYAGPTEGLPDAEEALAEAGIPAVIAYGDLYGARALSPHVFQASPSFLWQARRLASYLVKDRRFRRVGALLGSTPDGSTAGEALEEGLRLAGGSPPILGLYPEEGGDFDGALDRLEDAGVEAIVVHGDPSNVTTALEELQQRGSSYRTTAAARTVTAPRRIRRRPGREWRPQVVGFSLTIAPRDVGVPAGTVASDSYARGAHYLPVPSFRDFRRAFSDWWDVLPTGWEQRSYDAVLAIGWAARTAGRGQDLAKRLEDMKGKRFGGLDITLGPDDHTFVEASTVGLWVVPRPIADVPERGGLPERLPWVPLARGFSIDGETTDVLGKDWKYLFRNSPPAKAPAPRFGRMRFGVSTTRRDPVH